MGNIRGVISKDIAKNIKLKQTDLKGWQNATIYSKDYSLPANDIPAGTWKAICRRNGTWQRNVISNKNRSSKAANFIWNAAFLNLFLEPVTCPWEKVFQNSISTLHETYAVKVAKALGVFSSSFEKSMIQICGDSYLPGQRGLAQYPLLRIQVEQSVASALKSCKAKANSIQSGLVPMIEDRMIPVYRACIEESGER